MRRILIKICAILCVFFALSYVPKRLIDLNGNVVCKPSSLIALDDGRSLDDENEDNDE